MGIVEIYNQTTGERINNVSRIELFVNTFGKVSASITIKDIDLHIVTDKVKT